jgi:hypothetical protein
VGKPRAKKGRNTQTNSSSDHQAGESFKAGNRLQLEKKRMRTNGAYFKSNYGRWAPLDIFKGTKATALSSKSTRFHLCHFNAVEKC